jgi:hypothetical protein
MTLIVSTLPVLAPVLLAQDQHRFGINLSVSEVPQVGFTFNISSRIVVRPTLQFSVTKIERDVRTGVDDIVLEETTTQSGIDLDLLTAVAHVDRVGLYIGAGVKALFVWDTESVTEGSPPPEFSEFFEEGTNFQWSLSPRALFGLRVPVVDRLSVFGDLVLEYWLAPQSHSTRFRRVSLRTSALGITVYIG